jgi:hypothetical protein
VKAPDGRICAVEVYEAAKLRGQAAEDTSGAKSATADLPTPSYDFGDKLAWVLRPKTDAGRCGHEAARAFGDFGIRWVDRLGVSPCSAPHEAFALAFRPGEGFFHWLALRVAQHHLGQCRLRVDLLRDLRRGRRGRN